MLELVICLLMTIFYVAVLYIWTSEHDRDHPSTIKKRFVSVTVIMLLAPFVVWFMCHDRTNNSIWELLGLRWPGMLSAFTLPLILTTLPFMGSIGIQVLNGSWREYFRPTYWRESLQNLVWIRNHVMAPLSEEFTFRACMLPILLLRYSQRAAICIVPLFFGIAHLHHMIGRIHQGENKKSAILVSCFQFLYTTIFGIYSSYLFVRTGHFMAPFIAHAFCNHMGFPDIRDLFALPEPKQRIVYVLYVTGAISFYFLYPALTHPDLYENRLYI